MTSTFQDSIQDQYSKFAAQGKIQALDPGASTLTLVYPDDSGPWR